MAQEWWNITHHECHECTGRYPRVGALDGDSEEILLLIDLVVFHCELKKSIMLVEVPNGCCSFSIVKDALALRGGTTSA